MTRVLAITAIAVAVALEAVVWTRRRSRPEEDAPHDLGTGEERAW